MESSLRSNVRWVKVLGVRIHDVDAKDIVAFIAQTCRDGGRAIVSNVNIQAMNIAGAQPWFREFLNRSELVFCDGFGVSLASVILGQSWIRRNTPPDWMEVMMPAAVRDHLSLYFLGTRCDVIENAAQVYRARFPGLRIVGCHDGYFDKSAASPANVALVEEINRLHPDILVVGLGMPLQEQWILENWEHLEVKVAVPVGAMFDFIAGETLRAPRWVTDHGLEWLSRLFIEPRRLWRRYIVGIPLFFWRVALERTRLSPQSPGTSNSAN